MAKIEFVNYGVGADLSKDSLHCCFSGITGQGNLKVIAQKKFLNNNSGHKEFKEWIDKHRKNKGLTCQVLLEVTGVYHEELLFYLYDNGMVVCLELAKRVKKYLEVIGQKSKTDKLDGKGIAQMACERKFKSWKPNSKHKKLQKSF